MNESQKILCRNPGTDKFLVLGSAYLIGNYAYLFDSQILCQTLYIFLGLDASGSRLDDHHELLHAFTGTPPQMLQAGLHIHDDHILASEA